MHTTVQHRRAANTLASTPSARPAGAKPSPASTAQHCTTTAPVIGTLALCAAQCPDSRVGRSGCSAKLLLPLLLSGVAGVDAVDSFAFKLVSMSASSARRRSFGQSIPAINPMRPHKIFAGG